MRLRFQTAFMILILGGCCLLLPFNVKAQSAVIQQARKSIYQGYMLNQPAQWRSGIKQLRQAIDRQSNEALLLELALAEYGLIGYCVGSKDCDDVWDHIDRTQEVLDDLVEQESYSGPAYAVYGGLLAMKIGLNPAKAIYLGPRSSGYLDDAMKLAPGSPYTWVEHGNMRYHAPSIFGGDKEGAVEAFKKAVALFDQQPSARANNWLYLHSLAWLGQSYEAVGNYDEARKAYEKALAFAPSFTWVKNELLPKLTNR